jgi:hypothetical protein
VGSYCSTLGAKFDSTASVTYFAAIDDGVNAIFRKEHSDGTQLWARSYTSFLLKNQAWDIDEDVRYFMNIHRFINYYKLETDLTFHLVPKYLCNKF